jgi:hypothetical protein
VTGRYLAILGVVQLVALYFLDRLGIIRRVTSSIVESQRSEFPRLDAWLSDVNEGEANRDDMMRVVGLGSAVTTTGISLFVASVTAVLVGVVGARTDQPDWAVVGSFVAGGLCALSLVALSVVVIVADISDHANWKRIPRRALIRHLRNGISLRTPGPYRFIVVAVSIYLILATAAYHD